MEYCEYCRYYVNGRYYCSELEAIEAIADNHYEIVHCLSEDFIELGPGRIHYLPEHHNCRNCGAPVSGSKCDYCGTRH